MNRPPGNSRSQPIPVGALVSGYPAHDLAMMIRRYGPDHLAELERAVEAGRLDESYVAETRAAWAAITQAGRWFLDSFGSAGSAGGPDSSQTPDVPARLLEITAAQAAELLHVSPRHIGRLCGKGHLTGRHVGGRWLVARWSVEAYRRDMR